MGAISVVPTLFLADVLKKGLLIINLLIVVIHLLVQLGRMEVVFLRHFHYAKKEQVGISIKEEVMILQTYLITLDIQQNQN